MSTRSTPVPGTVFTFPTVRLLLACGIAAGPLFSATIIVQAMTRYGFDARRHPLSLLALGEHGWVQTANFLLSGVLVVAGVIGLRRALPLGRARTWVTTLLGVYGASLIWAGIFPADPADGYPPGTPDGVTEVSRHGLLHNLAPVAMGLSLIAAALVFARNYGIRWAAYSFTAVLAYLVLGFAAFPLHDYRLMLIGGIAIWTWASAACLRVLQEQH
ncbi:DUF998 domain-containing protein [Nocardia transvalensis]|uniref:DUF998 domain-containing protein n=1 Tax=Nocardia transvalensis TaxID=37333 RepID=UPI0018934C41|nr:DUF998 domain-containing protein [Nocardia transvalensis]MBF6332843.1 DUF998 domain-containing protein [Nocardia transvalensis]